jgi:hypothetical protein
MVDEKDPKKKPEKRPGTPTTTQPGKGPRRPIPPPVSPKRERPQKKNDGDT